MCCVGSIQPFPSKKKRKRQSLQRPPAPRKRKRMLTPDPSPFPPSPSAPYFLSHIPYVLPPGRCLKVSCYVRDVSAKKTSFFKEKEEGAQSLSFFPLYFLPPPHSSYCPLPPSPHLLSEISCVHDVPVGWLLSYLPCGLTIALSLFCSRPFLSRPLYGGSLTS